MKIKSILIGVCLCSIVFWTPGNAWAASSGNSSGDLVKLGGLSAEKSAPPQHAGKTYWRGVHVGISSGKAVEQLTAVVGSLARGGVNVIVGEINYGYQYQSHPELRAGNACSSEQIKKLLLECRMFNVRLIPQFQCLGHQSWKTQTAPLLMKYPILSHSRSLKLKGVLFPIFHIAYRFFSP